AQVGNCYRQQAFAPEQPDWLVSGSGRLTGKPVSIDGTKHTTLNRNGTRGSSRSLPSGYLPEAWFRGAIGLEGPMGRVAGFLSLVLGLAIGMYVYSRQMQSS